MIGWSNHFLKTGTTHLKDNFSSDTRGSTEPVLPHHLDQLLKVDPWSLSTEGETLKIRIVMLLNTSEFAWRRPWKHPGGLSTNCINEFCFFNVSFVERKRNSQPQVWHCVLSRRSFSWRCSEWGLLWFSWDNLFQINYCDGSSRLTFSVSNQCHWSHRNAAV